MDDPAGNSVKHELLLELIVNEPKLLERVPGHLAHQLLELAKRRGLLRETNADTPDNPHLACHHYCHQNPGCQHYHH